MRLWHGCPVTFFEKQFRDGTFTPHDGSIWLAETNKYAYQGCQHHETLLVLVCFDLDEDDVEDHSDMEVCQHLGRSYYLHRGPITSDRIQDILIVEK